MPETFCGDLGWHAAREHEGGSSVPEPVSTEPRQTDLAAVAGDEFREMKRVIRTALELCEHEVTLKVLFLRTPAVGDLVEAGSGRKPPVCVEPVEILV